MKRKISIIISILCLWTVLASCNTKSTYHNTTIAFSSPNNDSVLVEMNLNIPQDVELTTVDSDAKETYTQTNICRDDKIIGNIVCDKADIYSSQDSLIEIYQAIIDSENTVWSLTEEEERLKKGITILTLKSDDSDIGGLVFSEELNIYIGVNILGDSFTSEEADMLISSISIDINEN